MNIYLNRYFYVFVICLTAFVLLLLCTVSTPIASTFYFVYSEYGGGIRFGIWGWCFDDGACSSPLRVGYKYAPAITDNTTGAFVLYPISVVLSFLTLLSITPAFSLNTLQGNKFFVACAWASVASSAFAFLFAVGIGSVAVSRLKKSGMESSLGNQIWMSLAALLMLVVVAVSPFIFLPPPKEPKRSQSTRRHRRDEHGADLEARPSHRSTSRREREKHER